MRGFLQLELKAGIRRYRFLMLALVFVIFGIEGPLIAKLTPTLVKSMLGSQMTITLPKPDSVMAWQQFYKNVTQIGIYLLAIVASGTVSRELSQGTLVNLVTKGLARPVVILTKYLIAVMQWVVGIFLSFGISYAYTAYYFPDSHSPHPWLGLWPLLLFGLLFMAVVVFGSTLSASSWVGFLLGAGMYLALTLANLFKSVHRFNPVSLTGDNLALVQGTTHLSKLWPAMTITVAAAIALVLAAIAVLNHKRL